MIPQEVDPHREQLTTPPSAALPDHKDTYSQKFEKAYAIGGIVAIALTNLVTCGLAGKFWWGDKFLSLNLSKRCEQAMLAIKIVAFPENRCYEDKITALGERYYRIESDITHCPSMLPSFFSSHASEKNVLNNAIPESKPTCLEAPTERAIKPSTPVANSEEIHPEEITQSNPNTPLSEHQFSGDALIIAGEINTLFETKELDEEKVVADKLLSFLKLASGHLNDMLDYKNSAAAAKRTQLGSSLIGKTKYIWDSLLSSNLFIFKNKADNILLTRKMFSLLDSALIKSTTYLKSYEGQLSDPEAQSNLRNIFSPTLMLLIDQIPESKRSETSSQMLSQLMLP